MLLINCEVDIILTWSANCVIANSRGSGTFATTDTKLSKLSNVPAVTLLTEDNTKLLITIEIMIQTHDLLV